MGHQFIELTLIELKSIKKEVCLWAFSPLCNLKYATIASDLLREEIE